jgi:nucleotide-binding universal stress UspA family protein
MNDITSILVHLDASPRSNDRLAIGRRLAGQYGADLRALYAVTPQFIQMPYTVPEGAALAGILQKLDEDRRRQAREQFDRIAAQPGPEVQWSELDGDLPIWGVSQQALLADLLVLGQRESDPLYHRDLPGDFVESVLVGTGRPALIVPYANSVGTVATRILAAWNASRESTQALAAAIPLMQGASRVDIVCWQDDNTLAAEAQRGRLARYLTQHGVTATMHWYGPGPRDVGNNLLSLAADLGSDLLVLGCYGHTRAREFILGGTTRTVLKCMTLPVLMAH